MVRTFHWALFEVHPLALMTAGKIEKSEKLEVVFGALELVSEQLREGITKLTQEMWQEKISTPLVKEITREESFLSLIFHEVEHQGQIKWLLKRLTGWTDNEIYSLRN